MDPERTKRVALSRKPDRAFTQENRKENENKARR
jgi:hypothetical protein